MGASVNLPGNILLCVCACMYSHMHGFVLQEGVCGSFPGVGLILP